MSQRYNSRTRGEFVARRSPRRDHPALLPAKKTLMNSSPSPSQPIPSSQAASLLAAGVIALQATPAMALNMIELQDERQTNKNGLQLIYEVRTWPNPTPPGDPT